MPGSSPNRSPPRSTRPTPTWNARNETCKPPGKPSPAAYAMPVKKECDGCHSHKAAAIAAAEAAIAGAEERIRDATRRISICEDAAEILDLLARRLQAALLALRQVPHDLGEVYELIYAFIHRGGKMPRYGRWIEGATPA